MTNYDLEKRTLNFGVNLIKTLEKLNYNPLTQVVLRQIIRSGTSIGANYREANGAESRKDFIHKIFLSLKEARETKYWLEILMRVKVKNKDKLNELWKETNELTLIFGKIKTTCQNTNLKFKT